MTTVLLDADETLWDGVLVEGSVSLKLGTREVLKELHKRHYTLYVVSRNDEEFLTSQLEKFELDEYLDGVKVGWQPKSIMVAELGDLDEPVVFVDDDAFQIAEVQSRFPWISGYQLSNLVDLLDVDEIRDVSTQETRDRQRIIKEQTAREQAEVGYSGDYQDFLRKSKLDLTIRQPTDADSTRILQLLNRTNELKTTGLRYSKLPTDSLWVADLVDVYGDYGLIAVVLIQKRTESWFLRDMAISCRTMGRGIGSTMVVFITKLAQACGKKIVGFIEPTGKNWRMCSLYEYLQFEDQGGGYYASTDAALEYPDWLILHA